MLQPTDPTKKHDFMLVFEVTLGNPNGDPDQDNSPRQNLETDQGLVSDGCIKRKVRNFIDDYFSDLKGYDIFVKENLSLNKKIEDACTEVGLTFEKKEEKVAKKFGQDKELAVRKALATATMICECLVAFLLLDVMLVKFVDQFKSTLVSA